MSQLWCLWVFLMAATVGVVVTDTLHNSTTFWARPIGGTRFRYANLPVGATLAVAVSAFAEFPWAWYSLAAALGMFMTAVGWAWVDPPPCAE